MKQENPYPLRLEYDLAQKLKVIARVNSRSYNKELEFIVRQYVSWYEKSNGEIKVDERAEP